MGTRWIRSNGSRAKASSSQQSLHRQRSVTSWLQSAGGTGDRSLRSSRNLAACGHRSKKSEPAATCAPSRRPHRSRAGAEPEPVLHVDRGVGDRSRSRWRPSHQRILLAEPGAQALPWRDHRRITGVGDRMAVPGLRGERRDQRVGRYAVGPAHTVRIPPTEHPLTRLDVRQRRTRG